MPVDLRAALPALLPLAIQWTDARAREVALAGMPLDDHRLGVARAVGVQKPELIRVALVQALPLPEHLPYAGRRYKRVCSVQEWSDLPSATLSSSAVAMTRPAFCPTNSDTCISTNALVHSPPSFRSIFNRSLS